MHQRNWVLIPEQFDAFEENFHILRECSQLLSWNLNFNSDTLSSLVAMIHASIKRCRSALFVDCMNILNAITVQLRSHLPMSLFLMNSLLVILESVAIQPCKAKHCLSLAFHQTDFLNYHD